MKCLLTFSLHTHPLLLRAHLVKLNISLDFLLCSSQMHVQEKVCIDYMYLWIHVCVIHTVKFVSMPNVSLSPVCDKLTNGLQQVFNPKYAGSFGSRSKLGGFVYHNNIMGKLKIHLWPSQIGQMLQLPGVVSLNVLHNASFRVLDVVGTENLVAITLTVLFYPSVMACSDAVRVTQLTADYYY